MKKITFLLLLAMLFVGGEKSFAKDIRKFVLGEKLTLAQAAASTTGFVISDGTQIICAATHADPGVSVLRVTDAREGYLMKLTNVEDNVYKINCFYANSSLEEAGDKFLCWGGSDCPLNQNPWNGYWFVANRASKEVNSETVNITEGYEYDYGCQWIIETYNNGYSLKNKGTSKYFGNASPDTNAKEWNFYKIEYVSTTSYTFNKLTLAEAVASTDPICLTYEEQVLAGPLGTWSDAVQITGDFAILSPYVKLTEVEGGYRIMLAKADGTPAKGTSESPNSFFNASQWGGMYLTGTSGDGGEKGSIWVIAEQAEKKYSIRNLGCIDGTGSLSGRTEQGYLCISGITARIESKTAVNFEFCTIASSNTYSEVAAPFKATAVSAEVVATDAPWYVNTNKDKKEGEEGYGVKNYVLTANPTSNSCSYNTGSATDCFYAVYWNSGNLNYYADLSAYSAIRVYQADNTNVPRAFFINSDATNQQQVDGFVWNAQGGYYELDLAKAQTAVGNKKLVTLRSPSGKQSTCTAVKLVDPSIDSDIAYLLTGDPINGRLDASATAALNDENAKIYDATGLTNTEATSLTTANPNAIIMTTAGKLSNANNVMVGTTIANLVLTDGKPFALPEGASVSASTVNRSTAEGKYGTICLPCKITATTAATIYTATVEGDVVKLTEIEAANTVAGTPYIYKATAAAQSFTGGNWTASAPVNTSSYLKGTFVRKQAPVGSYVLQTQGGEQKFYVVAEGKQPYVPAYKAYLGTDASTNEAALRITPDEEATAIQAIDALVNGEAKIYDINGRKLQNLQKGLNIVNGVKVYVK